MANIPTKVQQEADNFCEQVGQLWVHLGTLRDVLEDRMEDTWEWREAQNFLESHPDSYVILPSL